MTCIVAVKRDGIVHMGADAASVSTSAMITRAMFDSKVFRNGPYLMGCAGSARMSQILQYKLDLPTPTGDLKHFLCTTLVDYIRQGLKDGGHSKVVNNEESTDGDLLVAIQGRIFTLYSDYQVTEYMDPFGSIGCGREYALGVLHVNYDKVESSKKLVKQALEAAEHFSIGVQKPFTILKG